MSRYNKVGFQGTERNTTLEQEVTTGVETREGRWERKGDLADLGGSKSAHST